MEENRIPLARAVRWRRIRSQTVPVLSFVAAAVATGWLWQFQGSGAQGIGEVDSPRVDITSPMAGMVVSLANQSRGQWSVYDHVRAGDVIARIEDQQLENNKSQLRQEVQRLINEISQRRSTSPAEGAAPVALPTAEPAWVFEQSQLELLDGQLAGGAGAPPTEPSENPQADSAPPELPASASAVDREALARLREARHDLESRWGELSRQTQLLEIAAPISGTLVAVYCWPGQMLPPGGLIATIAADHGRHIVGYIPEESPLVAKPGMLVTLRTRVAGARRMASEVEEVGQQIERIPRHQRPMATTPQWGTPVRIKMPNDGVLRPGALVDIFFDGSTAR